jgi:hypothetical protein
MKKLTPTQEANYIKRVVERNNSMVYEQEKNIRESLDRRSLKSYIRDTYMKPNNLTVDNINYIELVNNKIINTKLEADKYFKSKLKTKSNKTETTKKIKSTIKDIKKDSIKRDIKNLLKDVEKVTNVKPKKSKTLNNAVNLAFDMASQPKNKKYKDDVEDIEDIIKEVNKVSKASKSDKKELKMDKDILLQPYKYKNMSVIDQIANSLKNPEFEAIKKKKIIDSYSYDTISKFNNKYPELMLKLFKTEEGIEKILKKKADKLEKNKLSDIKKAERLKKYAEKAKALRQEKKAEKTKHLRDLTPEEHKKFTQARSYYMRKSKTSDILPKELNKTDPEALNGVCRQLAIAGFNTMSEQLFMKEYEG